MAPRDWRARTQEALSPRARRAPCESVEQIRPVNARGGSGVAQTRAPRAPEAERIAGICGSRAGVLASKRATHLHLGCSNAHSPHVGRHLRSEGSDVSVAELRNRDGKHKLCVHPPIFAVPSQRNAHHFQSSMLSEQADNGERTEVQILVGAKAPAGESGPTSFSKVCEGATSPSRIVFLAYK